MDNPIFREITESHEHCHQHTHDITRPLKTGNTVDSSTISSLTTLNYQKENQHTSKIISKINNLDNEQHTQNSFP